MISAFQNGAELPEAKALSPTELLSSLLASVNKAEHAINGTLPENKKAAIKAHGNIHCAYRTYYSSIDMNLWRIIFHAIDFPVYCLKSAKKAELKTCLSGIHEQKEPSYLFFAYVDDDETERAKRDHVTGAYIQQHDNGNTKIFLIDPAPTTKSSKQNLAQLQNAASVVFGENTELYMIDYTQQRTPFGCDVLVADGLMCLRQAIEAGTDVFTLCRSRHVGKEINALFAPASEEKSEQPPSTTLKLTRIDVTTLPLALTGLLRNTQFGRDEAALIAALAALPTDMKNVHVPTTLFGLTHSYQTLESHLLLHRPQPRLNEYYDPALAKLALYFLTCARVFLTHTNDEQFAKKLLSIACSTHPIIASTSLGHDDISATMSQQISRVKEPLMPVTEPTRDTTATTSFNQLPFSHEILTEPVSSTSEWVAHGVIFVFCLLLMYYVTQTAHSESIEQTFISPSP